MQEHIAVPELLEYDWSVKEKKVYKYFSDSIKMDSRISGIAGICFRVCYLNIVVKKVHVGRKYRR